MAKQLDTAAESPLMKQRYKPDDHKPKAGSKGRDMVANVDDAKGGRNRKGKK